MPTAATSDRRSAGIALCVASACGFGLMAIFAKQAYREGIGVTALLAARFVLAAAVFWAILGVRRAVRSGTRARAPRATGPSAVAPAPRAVSSSAAAPAPRAAGSSAVAPAPRAAGSSAAAPAPRAAGSSAAGRPPRATILTALALGGIGYSIQSACFFSALRHIDASLASLLLYTFPALVCCGAVALGREHVTPWKAMALALATAGTALVLLGGGSGGLEATGVLFGLAAAVTYAAYILIAEGMVGRIDPWHMSALIATGAAATLVVTGALTGALELPAATAWIWIAAIALLSTVAPIGAFLLGLERVGAPTASIVSTVEPVVTVSLAIVIFDEGFGPAQALGAVLVLGAVLALQSRRAAEVVSVAGHGASARTADLAAARAPARSAA